MGATVKIHYNPALAHQVRIAQALERGFELKGIQARATSNRDAEADTHVVLGNWYALEQWQDAKTIYIDRAYWGDPDCVSIHWLVNGEKHFTQNDEYREIPKTQPFRKSTKSIYLCDYNEQAPEGYDRVRLHPAQARKGETLEEALAGCGVAYGKRSTALVDASLAGLVVHTDDPHSPAFEISGRKRGRSKWLTHLAWHNWSTEEIGRGEFIDAIGNPYKAD